MAEELVMVTWRDAFFEFDTPEEGEEREDYLVRTVGFHVSVDAKFVKVAQELLPDGDGYRATTSIPIAVVESVVPLLPVVGTQALMAEGVPSV